MDGCSLPSAQHTMPVPTKSAEETEAKDGVHPRYRSSWAEAEGWGPNPEKKGREMKGRQEQLKRSRVRRRASGTGDELGREKKRSGNKAGVCPRPAGAGRTRATPHHLSLQPARAPQPKVPSGWGCGQRGARRPYPCIFPGF